MTMKNISPPLAIIEFTGFNKSAISESSKDQYSSIHLLFNSKNELEYLESKVTI